MSCKVRGSYFPFFYHPDALEFLHSAFQRWLCLIKATFLYREKRFYITVLGVLRVNITMLQWLNIRGAEAVLEVTLL